MFTGFKLCGPWQLRTLHRHRVQSCSALRNPMKTWVRGAEDCSRTHTCCRCRCH